MGLGGMEAGRLGIWNLDPWNLRLAASGLGSESGKQECPGGTKESSPGRQSGEKARNSI